MTTNQSEEEEQAAATVCAGVSAILSIVAGKDGQISIREIIKILEQIKQ